ncbi:hypothetical protein BXY51_009030 [Actinoplanes cyaneus]|nr:hypothetical protein [Actinoplanes cyaneus]
MWPFGWEDARGDDDPPASWLPVALPRPEPEEIRAVRRAIAEWTQIRPWTRAAKAAGSRRCGNPPPAACACGVAPTRTADHSR